MMNSTGCTIGCALAVHRWGYLRISPACLLNCSHRTTGNSVYADKGHYNRVAVDLDKWLQTLHGRRVAQVQLADEQEGLLDACKQWLEVRLRVSFISQRVTSFCVMRYHFPVCLVYSRYSWYWRSATGALLVSAQQPVCTWWLSLVACYRRCTCVTVCAKPTAFENCRSGVEGCWGSIRQCRTFACCD